MDSPSKPTRRERRDREADAATEVFDAFQWAMVSTFAFVFMAAVWVGFIASYPIGSGFPAGYWLCVAGFAVCLGAGALSWGASRAFVVVLERLTGPGSWAAARGPPRHYYVVRPGDGARRVVARLGGVAGPAAWTKHVNPEHARWWGGTGDDPRWAGEDPAPDVVETFELVESGHVAAWHRP